MVCKIDMDKVFDNVKWSILLKILEAHGFGQKWINWMWLCVATAQVYALVNVSSSEKFKPTKGFRQGESLSPF